MRFHSRDVATVMLVLDFIMLVLGVVIKPWREGRYMVLWLILGAYTFGFTWTVTRPFPARKALAFCALCVGLFVSVALLITCWA